MTDTLIKVENVSKKFCRNLKKSLWYGVQDIGFEIIGKSHRYTESLRLDEFWAIKNVSFELKRGECLGLIGQNGAGKSTLLRLINGLIKPDQGKITIHGKIGALIALGAGFNPILTGRENVYAAGAILGLSKNEIRNKYKSIVEFSEMEEFMDTPVQSYSSGMQVRLGFSICVELAPDVLLLDEVLAVGDLQFRIKCLSRIGEIMDRAAVIFVSHQVELVSHLCNVCLLLKKGEPKYLGDPQKAIKLYTDQTPVTKSSKWIQKVDWIHEIQFSQSHKKINNDTNFSLEIAFTSDRSLNDCVARIHFIDIEDNIVAEWRSSSHGHDCNVVKGINKFIFPIGTLPFSNGNYTLRFNFQPNLSAKYLIVSNDFDEIIVSGTISSKIRVQL